MVRKLLGLFASIVVPGIILGLGAYFTQKLFNLQISPNYTITSKIGEPVLLVQRFFTLCIGTAMICCGWWSLAVLYWVATHFLASLFLWKFLTYNWKTYTYCGSRQLFIQCQGWGNLSIAPSCVLDLREILPLLFQMDSLSWYLACYTWPRTVSEPVCQWPWLVNCSLIDCQQHFGCLLSSCAIWLAVAGKVNLMKEMPAKNVFTLVNKPSSLPAVTSLKPKQADCANCV